MVRGGYQEKEEVWVSWGEGSRDRWKNRKGVSASEKTETFPGAQPELTDEKEGGTMARGETGMEISK